MNTPRPQKFIGEIILEVKKKELEIEETKVYKESESNLNF